MSELLKAVLDQAMQLSPAERGELAAHLFHDLDAETDGDHDTAWGEEIQRRIDDLTSGREQPIPWEQARAMILDDRDDDR